MTNPITAILTMASVAAESATDAIEGAGAYVKLWRQTQSLEHKYVLKARKLDLLAQYGKQVEKARETISSLEPETVAYLEE